MARFWAKYIDDKLLGAARRISYCDEKEREQAIKEIGEHLRLLEKQLQGKHFFVGDIIGYVDIAASLVAIWLGIRQEVSGLKLFTQETHPNLWKWNTRFQENEVVNQTCPPRDKLVQYIGSLRKAPRSALE
ncbi:hypothetical protein ACFE04_014398 [Oxalis oulophora]